jgi:LmbE family N-acetylglucosaminyl deacetylase
LKVFLLAHQDDEIFFLPHIINSEKKLFIYLTNGVSVDSSITKLNRRTSEAKFVFRKYLETLNSRAVWCGLENSIAEGALHEHANSGLIDKLIEVLNGQDSQISAFFTTAFEGAHQDHDSAAVITRKLGEIFQVGIIEMSTYPQWFSSLYSFKVLRPRVSVESFRFKRIQAVVMAARMMASYKTQIHTWLGLGPATLSAFAFRAYESSSPGPIEIIEPCFYQFRGRAIQSEVLECLLRSD